MDINMPNGDEFFNHFNSMSEIKPNAEFDYKYEKQAIEYFENNKSTIASEINPVEFDILNRNFTADEIKSSIMSIKSNKSPGIDYIPAEFIKAGVDIISNDVAELFNYVIENRDFPENWAIGLRNPIYKSGIKINTSNYRGITVLPVFEKIFEITVQKRLEFVSEAFNRNDRYNGGFLKGSRTSDNVFILNGLVQRQLTLGQPLIVCYIDFSQAFDRVNRNILFYKLKKSGLTGRVIDTLQNLYTKTRYHVKYKGKISDPIHEYVGVNQGGNTSPTLFRRYLHDLKDYLDEYTGICISDEILLHMLWADDLVMVSCTPKHAQRQLDGLSKFCAPNQMVANELKTKYMVFGKLNDFSLQLNGKHIEKVSSYKYLGNIISCTRLLSGDVFKENADYLCNKARQSVFAMIGKLKNLDVPTRTILYLYQTLVQPVLVYGSDVWGVSTGGLSKVDKIFYWFLRLILRVKFNTSHIMMVGEVGMFPPSIQCHKNVLLYFQRLNNMPDGSVLKSVFNESKRLSLLGYHTWYTKTHELAKYYGLDITNIGDTTDLSKQDIKDTIENHYIESWKEKLLDTENFPILRTYRLFKIGFECESYLSLVKNSKYRIALSTFRTSCHSLEVERGRYTNPITPLERRLCFVCREIEDEIHFIMHCQLFETERLDLFGRVGNKFPVFCALDETAKFIFLMQNSDAQLITWVAKFIHHSMNKRNDNIISEDQT